MLEVFYAHKVGQGYARPRIPNADQPHAFLEDRGTCNPNKVPLSPPSR